MFIVNDFIGAHVHILVMSKVGKGQGECQVTSVEGQNIARCFRHPLSNISFLSSSLPPTPLPCFADGSIPGPKA